MGEDMSSESLDADVGSCLIPLLLSEGARGMRSTPAMVDLRPCTSENQSANQLPVLVWLMIQGNTRWAES